jgi:hypothetical protein
LNLSICDQGNWQMALIGSNSLDVDSILAQFPGPIRLTAGKNLFKVVLIACLVFEYFLVKALVEREGVPLVLWCVIVIVLLQIVRCTLVLLRRDCLALTLDRDGFTIQYLLRSRTYPWSNVGEFVAAKARPFDLIMYNNRSPSTMERVRSVIPRLRFGRNATLPDTYNLGAERLAQLMSLWQQRTLSSR